MQLAVHAFSVAKLPPVPRTETQPSIPQLYVYAVVVTQSTGCDAPLTPHPSIPEPPASNVCKKP